MNALVTLEKQLQPLAPHFSQVLGRTMPVERLIRTVVLSVERLPKLLECNRQSLFNAAMTAAVLGLEVDGVTGQAYLIPFKNQAQLVIGYKGFNTLAARAGITITGSVVRDGDAFDYDLGEGWITHKPASPSTGRIVAAWAKAAHQSRPPVIAVLNIDELLAVKNRSPGAKRSDSPWNDQAIGFPAMCEKTVKRRLSRSLPLSIMQSAARIDEAVDEQGRSAWISPERGVVVEGEIIEANETPSADDLIGTPNNTNGSAMATVESADEYSERWSHIIAEATDAAQLAQAWNADKPARDKIEWPDDGTFAKLKKKVASEIEFLRS